MKLPKLDWRGASVAGAALLVAGAGALTATARQNPPDPYLQNFPNFAPNVTPQMPGDVDPNLKSQLEAQKQFAQVQREFDLYSWQMFLALNWPTNNQGQPAPTLTDTAFGPPHWTMWHASSDIFQTDGAKPTACAQAAAGKPVLQRAALASKPISRGLPAFSLAAAKTDPRRTRHLGVISAVGDINAATTISEIGQAFTGPLIDQNGQFVFYEILLDPNEVGYICANALYNINGQVAFSGAGGKVDMPWGADGQDWSGAFELKLSWRVLQPSDAAARYFNMPATIMDQDANGQPVERQVTVGLVGMHIGHKTNSSPQWIWATFEHVDNLDVDPIANPGVAASFNDPNCQLCTVNQQPVADPTTGAYPRVPTQVSRTIPIPDAKQALNAQAQAALKAQGSVWQYYQLIDTQWPTSPSSAPSAWNSGLPGSVTNKPGGQPTPTFLTNITMETYFQFGNQEACNSQENVPSTVNCWAPPNQPEPAATPRVWTSPQNNSGAPALPGNHTTIFSTESCMGCHSSAGIYTSYNPQTQSGNTSGQLTGDFSWLFSQKASWFYGSGSAAKAAKAVKGAPARTPKAIKPKA